MNVVGNLDTEFPAVKTFLELQMQFFKDYILESSWSCSFYRGDEPYMQACLNGQQAAHRVREWIYVYFIYLLPTIPLQHMQ